MIIKLELNLELNSSMLIEFDSAALHRVQVDGVRLGDAPWVTLYSVLNKQQLQAIQALGACNSEPHQINQNKSKCVQSSEGSIDTAALEVETNLPSNILGPAR